MKFFKLQVVGAALSTVSAESWGQIPLSTTTPGWMVGTEGAPIQIAVFYDLLCPASKADHYFWKSLFPQDSHIEGKKYEDLIEMQVTPFVLPYHLQSWSITKVVHLLQDKCQDDPSTCQMEAYAELAWKDWEVIAADTYVTYNQFRKNWSKLVAQTLSGVTADEIYAVFDSATDTHNSEVRSRSMWKYGTGMSVSGTPTHFINGVQLTDVPDTEEEWKALLKSLYPGGNAAAPVEPTPQSLLEKPKKVTRKVDDFELLQWSQSLNNYALFGI